MKRAATGATDYVVCVRAPLNHIEQTQDLHLLLAEAKKLAGASPLIRKIEDNLRVLEDNNEKTLNHHLKRIAELEHELEGALESGSHILQSESPRASGDGEGFGATDCMSEARTEPIPRISY